MENEPITDQQNSPMPKRKQQTIVAEMWAFLRVRKKFWLAPIIIALMLLGLLMFLASSAGVVSPFIYML